MSHFPRRALVLGFPSQGYLKWGCPELPSQGIGHGATWMGVLHRCVHSQCAGLHGHLQASLFCPESVCMCVCLHVCLCPCVVVLMAPCRRSGCLWLYMHPISYKHQLCAWLHVCMCPVYVWLVCASMPVCEHLWHVFLYVCFCLWLGQFFYVHVCLHMSASFVFTFTPVPVYTLLSTFLLWTHIPSGPPALPLPDTRRPSSLPSPGEWWAALPSSPSPTSSPLPSAPGRLGPSLSRLPLPSLPTSLSLFFCLQPQGSLALLSVPLCIRPSA